MTAVLPTATVIYMNMNESNPWVWVALVAFLVIVFGLAIWGGFAFSFS